MSDSTFSHLESGPISLRRFYPVEDAASVDRHGFFVSSGETLKVEDLFKLSAALIVSPAWTGKSYVADQIGAYLQRRAEDAGDAQPFGTYFDVTHLEVQELIEPPWWGRWKESEGRACWVIDSLDEDWRLGGFGIKRAFTLLRQLKDAERSRLCLILLCRESDVPNPVLTELASSTQSQTVQLLCDIEASS